MAEEKQTAYSRLLQYENAMCRRLGRSRMERYANNYAYYSGDNLPPDNVEQPLSINYVAPICQKANFRVWGEIEDGRDIIGWHVESDPEVPSDKDVAAAIRRFLYNLFRANDANTLLLEAGLNGSIFGDTVFRLRWDDAERRVRIESILPEYVHFRWHPSDLNVLEEAIVAYPISRADAYEQYGTRGNSFWNGSQFLGDQAIGFAMYWEHWTAEKYSKWVDDQLVDEGPNPFSQLTAKGTLPGLIPFVHIPNMRAGGEFFGYGDAEPILLLQDELNRKMADEGDVVNTFAHPITIVNKYFGDVSQLPVGPDQIWDLGREGEAKLLQWDGTPPAIHDYVELLMTILMDTSAMSSIAFGRHRGTQQSAIALAVEMMPMVERARWKRSLWTVGLRRLARLAVLITERMGGKLPFAYADLLAHHISVLWAPMLPRDRLALVNENIALVVNRLRSMEKALVELGESEASEEREHILNDLKQLVEIGVQLQGISMSGSASGSSVLPEGMSDASVKGRPIGSVSGSGRLAGSGDGN